MTRVIDFPGSGDHRAIAAEVLEATREDSVVGLPCETGYVLAVSAIQDSAVRKLITLGRSIGVEPVLCLAHYEQLADFVEAVPAMAERLVRRAWPGPIVVEFDARGPWTGPPIAAALAEHYSAQALRCGSFGHPLQQTLARAQREPLLVVPVPAPQGKSWNAADGLELAQTWGEQVSLIVNAGFVRNPQVATVVRVADKATPVITKPGAYSGEQIHRLMAKLTLFVCTGNTCRSPLAEGLFRRLLCERLECSESELAGRGYLVASAGVASTPGAPASRETLSILEDEGIDLSDHTSQPVTDQLVAWADRVLTMTDRHRSVVVQAFPEFAEKVEGICLDGADIADPIGGDHTVYAECRDQIRECLEHWVERVISDV